MGTLIDNPTAEAVFDGQIHKKGVDLKRSDFTKFEGLYVANPTATIRPGMLVSRDSSGYVVPSVGTDILGWARWGQVSLGSSVKVDVPVTLNGTTPTSVGRGSISNVSVRSAVNMGGTPSVGGTDYTLDGTAGTIARIALGNISDGQTVYVTFTYALTDADYDIDGRFFQNQPENRTQYEAGRLAVITGWSKIYTIEWASGSATTGRTYSVNTALYGDADGKANSTAANEFVGRCYQVPTASDPYMGIISHGDPSRSI
jgi:hypothetical protein